MNQSGNNKINKNNDLIPERNKMNIEHRLNQLETEKKNEMAALVEVYLCDGRHGMMLWSDALLAALDGQIEKVVDDGDMAALIGVMMKGEDDD